MVSFKKELADKTRFLILNKCDIVDNDMIGKLEQYFIDLGLHTFVISAQTGEGIENLKEGLAEMMEKEKEQSDK